MPHALIVFAKVPEPGRVKTRLTSLLTPEEAASLYEAFLRDALAQYQALDTAIRLYLEPSEGALSPVLTAGSVSLHEQVGASLGERMLHAFLDTFAAGYDQAVIIGTDHPTLPLAFVEEAFRVLDDPLSVCIGPSEDGGYYLLGMNDFYPQLFEGITYSQPHVFEQTLERIRASRAHCTVLPMWYDVDTPEDLHRLCTDLEQIHTPLPYTRGMLVQLGMPERLGD